MPGRGAWAAGAAPDHDGWLYLDVDATITIDHSDNKESAAATWKHTFGFHPLLVFLDRSDIAAGEALAGLLRAGNAGSNTAADHITVLGWALDALPAAYRPDSADPYAPKILIRSDSAGATHGFAAACRAAGVGFSLGCAVEAHVRDAAEALNDDKGWYPAIDADGGIREGAWVAEATDLCDLSKWPTGTRLILRKERPHPGAQLRFTDSDGHRITGFLTDTPDGVVPGQLAGLELRHRQHARVEDRIRQAKATGLRNLPFHSFQANSAWLEIIMAATDLVAWAKLIGFADHPDLARCEIETFRYRILHVAARITRGARQLRLRIDAPGAGRRRSPPPGTASAPRSPNRKTPTRRDERPPALGSPPHRSDTGRPVTPMRQSTPQADHHRLRPHPRRAARKIEASFTIEPANKADRPRVLQEVGVATPSDAIVKRRLPNVCRVRIHQLVSIKRGETDRRGGDSGSGRTRHDRRARHRSTVAVVLPTLAVDRLMR